MNDNGIGLDTYRLSDGRLLRDITLIDVGMIADGASAAMAGTIYRKVKAAGDRLERRDDGTWLVIAGTDGQPLLWGSLDKIADWLRLDPAPPPLAG